LAHEALHQGRFNALAEYALKGQDPSFDNGYTYGLGSALLVSTSYARRGFVALLESDQIKLRARFLGKVTVRLAVGMRIGCEDVDTGEIFIPVYYLLIESLVGV